MAKARTVVGWSRSVALAAAVIGTMTLSAGGRPAAPPRAAPPKVADLLARAAKAALLIDDLRERATILALIAQAHHHDGDKAAAERLLKQARDEAGKIEEDTPLRSALGMIILVEAKRGNAAGTQKACAVTENQRMQSSLRHTAIHELATNGHFQQAHKFAAAEKGDDRISALFAIARAEAKAGKVDAARKALAHRETEWRHYDLLCEIAKAYHRAKEPAKAKAALAEAKAVWEKTTGKNLRPANQAWPMANYALDQADAGDVAGALNSTCAAIQYVGYPTACLKPKGPRHKAGSVATVGGVLQRRRPGRSLQKPNPSTANALRR